jgi:hypothetical protein
VVAVVSALLLPVDAMPPVEVMLDEVVAMGPIPPVVAELVVVDAALEVTLPIEAVGPTDVASLPPEFGSLSEQAATQPSSRHPENTTLVLRMPAGCRGARNRRARKIMDGVAVLESARIVSHGCGLRFRPLVHVRTIQNANPRRVSGSRRILPGIRLPAW